MNVERGLYVLRYVGSATNGPTIFVRSSPGDEENVTVVPFPGDKPGQLAAPGSVAVIVAEQPATLQITARAVSASGSLVAELKLEPLGGEAAAQSAVAPEPAPVAPEVFRRASVERPVEEKQSPAPVQAPFGRGEGRLTLLAHVSRRGDVVEGEGEWVAGPDAPSPIEGLALDCPASVGELRFQVLASGEARWSEWLPSGAFGGSRGRAVPLVGVRVRLVPAAGTDASLGGEALFLGSAIIRKDGSELEFRSAAGLDPLLGLRLEIKRETQAPLPRPSLASAQPAQGRVRVFRATGRRSG